MAEQKSAGHRTLRLVQNLILGSFRKLAKHIKDCCIETGGDSPSAIQQAIRCGCYEITLVQFEEGLVLKDLAFIDAMCLRTRGVDASKKILYAHSFVFHWNRWMKSVFFDLIEFDINPAFVVFFEDFLYFEPETTKRRHFSVMEKLDHNKKRQTQGYSTDSSDSLSSQDSLYTPATHEEMHIGLLAPFL